MIEKLVAQFTFSSATIKKETRKKLGKKARTNLVIAVAIAAVLFIRIPIAEHIVHLNKKFSKQKKFASKQKILTVG